MLEFVGRADDQVKVRGFRVEPGEVEAVLAAHPEVAAAAVAAVRRGRGCPAGRAGWSGRRRRGDPPAAELRRYLAERLPEYMVPAVVHGAGRAAADREREAGPGGAARPRMPRGRDRRGYAAPRGGEELLAGIWSPRCSGVGRVGADDNFFELGGHSLLATQVVSRVREVFGAEVPVAALFEHPTVAGAGRR